MAGAYHMVYMCPETLPRLSTALANLHRSVGIKLLAVDEAHCVSQWGHDFRPAYLRIRDIFDGIEAEGVLRIPTMALTATATERVQEGICSSLFHSRQC